MEDFKELYLNIKGIENNMFEYDDEVLKKEIKAQIKKCFCKTNVMPKIMEEIAKYDPIVNDKGNLSMKLTLKSIGKDCPFLIQALYVISHVRAKHRNQMLSYMGPGAERRYSPFVPYFLSAYKEHRNIQYREWKFYSNTESIFLEMATNTYITKYILGTPEHADWFKDRIVESYIKELGNKYIHTKKPYKGMSARAAKEGASEAEMEMSELDVDYSLNIPQSAIKAKLWYAHPSMDTRYTISNLKNWDSIDKESNPIETVYKYTKAQHQRILILANKETLKDETNNMFEIGE